MRKLFSLALATLITVSTVTTSAMPGKTSTTKRVYRISLSDINSAGVLQNSNSERKKKFKIDENNNNSNNISISQEKTLIAEINAIEDQMKTTTAVLQNIIDAKSSKLKESLKKEGLTKAEKQALKDEYRIENEDLYNELYEMQKPYMEQIKIKQKQFYDVISNKNKV